MKTEFTYPTNGYIDRATKLGHKVKIFTTLFGKEYVYMEDPEGNTYLIRADY